MPPFERVSSRAAATLAALFCLALGACATLGDRNAAIPTRTILAGDSPGTVLVVVLPGRRDNAQRMDDAGVATAVQAQWPEADVVLTSATMAYYTDGQLASRLHEQLIAPARANGYREIWMMGASLGGMGTLLYERGYPGDLDGLVLLAPFLGDRRVQREIAEAGGITHWTPGPTPDEVDRSNYSRELWRFLQTWQDDPAKGERVWIAYGDRDRLRQAIPLIAPLVPDAQILERSGGHTWSVWVPAASDIMQAARP